MEEEVAADSKEAQTAAIEANSSVPGGKSLR